MRTRDEAKERAIHQKGLQLIVEEGFDGLSMHKLAKAAGVSPGTIYIYYKDREDLIKQIAAQEIDNLLAASLVDFNPQMNFSEGLRKQWQNRAKYFMEHPLEMKFMEQIRYSPYHNEPSMERSSFVKTMSEFIHKAINNKELRPLPLEVYWSLAFAPLYKLIEFHVNQKGMNGRKYLLTDHDLDQALNAVLQGLKPEK
ncbi:MAG: TetR family transcriptional regulator [Flammeovirgaceae bacterium]|nr:TetR family transcriptional regulator [Flammeovirgaceae bacterium]MBR08999.1 TetR family transcriptional regulator [Rickettsiales bacterium]HCX23361.1 TetR/AcrR family transcriptional regulator [Cytophagales bacterium]|tara:strand:+ start:9909 stop:10502 length:594 start_codon:yes stop_codon:yes gene_type:complete